MSDRKEMLIKSFFDGEEIESCPEDKKNHFLKLIDEVQKMPFNDCICYYDDFDDSIEINLYFNNNIKLLMSFLDLTDESAFSIYRSREHLVSDILNLSEIILKFDEIKTAGLF